MLLLSGAGSQMHGVFSNCSPFQDQAYIKDGPLDFKNLIKHVLSFLLLSYFVIIDQTSL